MIKSAYFVDSQCEVYRPLKVRKVGYVGFFGLNPLLKDWWKDREIHIEVEFSKPSEQIELNVLKEMLILRVDKSKGGGKQVGILMI